MLNWGCRSVIEFMLCMQKALGWIPSTTTPPKIQYARMCEAGKVHIHFICHCPDVEV